MLLLIYTFSKEQYTDSIIDHSKYNLVNRILSHLGNFPTFVIYDHCHIRFVLEEPVCEMLISFQFLLFSFFLQVTKLWFLFNEDMKVQFLLTIS